MYCGAFLAVPRFRDLSFDSRVQHCGGAISPAEHTDLRADLLVGQYRDTLDCTRLYRVLQPWHRAPVARKAGWVQPLDLERPGSDISASQSTLRRRLRCRDRRVRPHLSVDRDRHRAKEHAGVSDIRLLALHLPSFGRAPRGRRPRRAAVGSPF